MRRNCAVLTMSPAGAPSHARYSCKSEGYCEVWGPKLQAFRWKDIVHDLYEAFNANPHFFRDGRPAQFVSHLED